MPYTKTQAYMDNVECHNDVDGAASNNTQSKKYLWMIMVFKIRDKAGGEPIGRIQKPLERGGVWCR